MFVNFEDNEKIQKVEQNKKVLHQLYVGSGARQMIKKGVKINETSGIPKKQREKYFHLYRQVQAKG